MPAGRCTSTRRPASVCWTARRHHISPWLEEKARKTTKQLVAWCSLGRTAQKLIDILTDVKRLVFMYYCIILFLICVLLDFLFVISCKKRQICLTYMQSSMTGWLAGSLRACQMPAGRRTSAGGPASVCWTARWHHISPWLEEKARKTTKQLAAWCSQGGTSHCTRGLDSGWWSWRMESATVLCRLHILMVMMMMFWGLFFVIFSYWWLYSHCCTLPNYCFTDVSPFSTLMLLVGGIQPALSPTATTAAAAAAAAAADTTAV